jgi:LysM repeat protein
MKSIVPYSKEIKFNSKIAEICSISLEHELNISDSDIEGNFIISGEYRAHEVSVNKDEFTYKLPFSVDVTDEVLKESIDFEITDFTYEVIGDDTLKVNIEFCVTADEKEGSEEQPNDEFREAIVEEVNDLFLNEESDAKEEAKEKEDDRLDKESEELILNSATNKESEYTTYNIHIVKNGDTIESIIAMYQTDITTLKNYNNIDNINIGDKIIIPSLDE